MVDSIYRPKRILFLVAIMLHGSTTPPEMPQRQAVWRSKTLASDNIHYDAKESTT